jgi:hypothetical protein
MIFVIIHVDILCGPPFVIFFAKDALRFSAADTVRSTGSQSGKFNSGLYGLGLESIVMVQQQHENQSR